MLPVLDNHDARIRYYELMLRAPIGDIQEIPLPELPAPVEEFLPLLGLWLLYGQHFSGSG